MDHGLTTNISDFIVPHINISHCVIVEQSISQNFGTHIRQFIAL
jgi:hypothetical protein